MNALRLYLQYISISIRCQMAYKTSFILSSVGYIAMSGIEFIGILFLFERFGTLGEWSLQEIALFYGSVNISFSIADGVSRGFHLFSNLVKSGDFDRFLLRPRSFFLQIMGTELQLLRFGRLAQGLFVLIWALASLDIPILSSNFLLLILSTCGMVLVFVSLFIIQASISFWSIESLEFMNSFTYGGVQLGQYPITIYKKWFQKIFMFVIPIAVVSYFPLSYTLGKSDMHWLITFCFPFIGFVFFGLSLLFFRVGVRHYKSTGS